MTLLVVFATLVQFVLGAVWYGALFGKRWMKIMGMDAIPEDELKRAHTAMAPYYAVEFFLTLIGTIALSYGIAFYSALYSPLDYVARLELGLTVAGYLFAFFIVPIQISGVIWGNTKKHFWREQVTIMVGMKFVGLILATLILVA